eukprot:scaffold2963_cov250-Pinguiococcus_pyrenoidosus.AAC.27
MICDGCWPLPPREAFAGATDGSFSSGVWPCRHVLYRYAGPALQRLEPAPSLILTLSPAASLQNSSAAPKRRQQAPTHPSTSRGA